MSPSAARAVVRRTMATNNTANAELNGRLLATYEAGSAFALDDASYRGDRAARFRPPNSPFTVDISAVAVARRASWPARFLAVGTQRSLLPKAPAGPSCDALLYFERQSAGGRWRLFLEPTVNASASPRPATGAGGFAAPVSTAARAASRSLPGKLVKAFYAEETSGRLGPFSKSDFTGSCWQLPNPRLDLIGAEASGFSQRDLFSVLRPADTSAVALRGGSTLVMFTLRFEDQLIASSSSRAIPWAHASLKKNPGAAWTYFLPTGTYSQVNESGELEVAVLLGANAKSWRVIGAYTGVTSVRGQKAKHSSTSGGGTLASFVP